MKTARAKKKRVEYRLFVKNHKKCPLSPSIRKGKLFFECVALGSVCEDTGSSEMVFE